MITKRRSLKNVLLFVSFLEPETFPPLGKLIKTVNKKNSFKKSLKLSGITVLNSIEETYPSLAV